MKKYLLATIFMGATISNFSTAAESRVVTPVVATPAALKTIEYTTLTPGTGPSPKATDSVVVNYEGRFKDGRIFDSSYARHRTSDFQVNTVIPCWTEALQRMKVGEKARVVCPSGVAYGANGIAGVIPADATLIFEIHLIKIK